MFIKLSRVGNNFLLSDLLKLVLEVAGTSLVRIEHCKSQRLVLSVKGNIDKLEGEPVRARGLC